MAASSLIRPLQPIHKSHRWYHSARTRQPVTLVSQCIIRVFIIYSFASSLTVPTFSLGPYFLSTLSLWYCSGHISNNLPRRYCTATPKNDATKTSRPAKRNNRSKQHSSTYLPELLTRVLPAHPLQDLRAARVLLYKAVQLVHILVYNYVQSLLDCVVLRDLLRCELLGHCGRVRRRGARGAEGRA